MEHNTRLPDPNNENRSNETDAKELIRKHIEDPNHEITDDDIRNVKIDLDSETAPAVGAEALARLEEREDADTDADENNKNEGGSGSSDDETERPVTPWDITHE